MGISGPKSDDNDELNSAGMKYERNHGMLLNTKNNDGDQIGLVSQRVKIGVWAVVPARRMLGDTIGCLRFDAYILTCRFLQSLQISKGTRLKPPAAW